MTAPRGVPHEERREEMRRKKGNKNGTWPSHVLNAGVVNINNISNVTNMTKVTNVTQVAEVHGRGGYWSSNKKKSKKYRGFGKRDNRMKNPKLLRYCGTCGLLDRQVVSNMSNDELCDGAVDVMRHGAGKISSGVGNVAGSIGDFFGSVFSMFGSICDSFS